MKTIIFIVLPTSMAIGCILMYFALKYMTVNEICISIFILCLLMAFISGSLVRSTARYDKMNKCNHEKFIGDVCARCGYCYSDKKL